MLRGYFFKDVLFIFYQSPISFYYYQTNKQMEITFGLLSYLQQRL